MRLGLCTQLEALDEAAEAGFDYAEMSASALAPGADEAAFAPIRRRMLAGRVRVEAFNGFLPADVRVTGPQVDRVRLRAHMDRVLRRAGEVGAAVVVFGSGGARRLPEGFPAEEGWRQLAEAARLAADLAADNGITIAMEPLFQRGCNFFNRVEQGSEFVDRIGRPALKLLADLFHMAAEQEPLEHVAAAGARLAHIHVPAPSLPEMAEGPDYDFAAFFDALRRAGYRGRVSLEDNGQGLARCRAPRLDACRAARHYLGTLICG